MTAAVPGFDAGDRIIREAECKAVTGLSRSTRWRLERSGQFPARRQLAVNACGWLQSEVQAWLKQRAAIALSSSTELEPYFTASKK